MRSRATQKITRPIFPSVRSLRTSHRPFAEIATIGHAKRPAELDLLNVPPHQFAIFQGQPQDPLPHGAVSEGGFVEERRELLGAISQFSLCPILHQRNSPVPSQMSLKINGLGFDCSKRSRPPPATRRRLYLQAERLAQIDPLHLRIARQRLRTARAENPPVVDHVRAVGHRQRLAHVVVGHQDADAAPASDRR